MKLLAIWLATTAVLALCSTPACAESAESGSGDPAASGAAGDVVVTAPRREDEARETKKSAYNIVEVQSAETIGKYPDFNAAEAWIIDPD